MCFHGQLRNIPPRNCFITVKLIFGAVICLLGGSVLRTRPNTLSAPTLSLTPSDHIRTHPDHRLSRAHSGAQQKDCELSFHAIYKFLVPNRSEEHWQ